MASQCDSMAGTNFVKLYNSARKQFCRTLLRITSSFFLYDSSFFSHFNVLLATLPFSFDYTICLFVTTLSSLLAIQPGSLPSWTRFPFRFLLSPPLRLSNGLSAMNYEVTAFLLSPSPAEFSRVFRIALECPSEETTAGPRHWDSGRPLP
ncbi:uncharacterized protein LY79DRAFT_539386 [Colletotrichum navitas]|uniref:Uncharacterized protein n=1 Tax=Colletotrichum navitas TaxID=681940 RepID=A0AAD8Q8E3_9PEZI|nr:uncharacterized protein LY79DRAFT_539386 [Colletotrichum navitas]KAK1597885.1 hypothetical protein LY79DRAFT_539386 [Colletotrichum navitas]